MALDYYLIGGRIRFYRRQCNLSQVDIAERIGKTSAFINYIEKGEKHASLETLVDIANALRISTDMLLVGNLRIDQAAAGAELQPLLRDCSPKGKYILIETVKELKRILRNNVEPDPSEFIVANRD